MAHQKDKLVGLARRLLNHNLNGTTDQADEIMIKPVSDYVDDDLIRSEVDKIFGYLIGHDARMVWIAIDMMSIFFVTAFVIYAWQAFRDLRWRYGFIELILFNQKKNA